MLSVYVLKFTENSMSEAKVDLFLNCPFFILKFLVGKWSLKNEFETYLLWLAKLLLFEGSMYQWFDILSEVAVKRKHSFWKSLPCYKLNWDVFHENCSLYNTNFGNRMGIKLIVSLLIKWRWSHPRLNITMHGKIGLKESRALVTKTIS